MVEQIAESVVLVGVGDCAGRVGQHPNCSAPVVLVEARGPDVRNDLVFADALEPVGVGAGHCARAVQLFHDLRVAGGVEVINQISSGDAVDGFCNAVSEAVVGPVDSTAGLLYAEGATILYRQVFWKSGR